MHSLRSNLIDHAMGPMGIGRSVDVNSKEISLQPNHLTVDANLSFAGHIVRLRGGPVTSFQFVFSSSMQKTLKIGDSLLIRNNGLFWQIFEKKTFVCIRSKSFIAKFKTKMDCFIVSLSFAVKRAEQIPPPIWIPHETGALFNLSGHRQLTLRYVCMWILWMHWCKWHGAV